MLYFFLRTIYSDSAIDNLPFIMMSCTWQAKIIIIVLCSRKYWPQFLVQQGNGGLVQTQCPTPILPEISVSPPPPPPPQPWISNNLPWGGFGLFSGTTHCMHISYLINEYVWRWSLVFFHQFSSIIILMTEIILWFNQDLFYDWVIIVIFSLLVAIQSFFFINKSQEFSIMFIKTSRSSSCDCVHWSLANHALIPLCELTGK